MYKTHYCDFVHIDSVIALINECNGTLIKIIPEQNSSEVCIIWEDYE